MEECHEVMPLAEEWNDGRMEEWNGERMEWWKIPSGKWKMAESRIQKSEARKIVQVTNDQLPITFSRSS